MDTTELDLSLPVKALEATVTISRNKQVIRIVSSRNRDHHLPKEEDLQRAIVDTTTIYDSGN